MLAAAAGRVHQRVLPEALAGLAAVQMVNCVMVSVGQIVEMPHLIQGGVAVVIVVELRVHKAVMAVQALSLFAIPVQFNILLVEP
jgi:hypothetical protein